MSRSIFHPFAILLALMVVTCNNAKAQSAESTSTFSVAKKMGLYVFPNDNQSAEQLEKDEFDCYKWAVEQSGIDPMTQKEAVAAEAQNHTGGTMVGGAAVGAGTGAAVGAIAGDAGKGAAIGATLGAMRGIRAGRAAKAHEQAANQKKADQINAANKDEFVKAYSACMEAKGYTVK